MSTPRWSQPSRLRACPSGRVIVPLRVTQDRLAERRFVERQDIAVAPWREVASGDDEALAAAITELGMPVRLKAAFGGYDGRSQIRVASGRGRRLAWMDLGRPAGQPVLVERELQFAAELSVVCARSVDGGVAPFPVARNVHDDGILVESVMPADVHRRGRRRGTLASRARLAEAMDLVGVLTVELFLLRDGTLVVNELAPRVHNSGHATIEATATSQFEQHVRAICGLPPGRGRRCCRRPRWSTSWASAHAVAARLGGVAEALADPGVHLHLYGKREVFERRKMGHVTVLGASWRTDGRPLRSGTDRRGPPRAARVIAAYGPSALDR